MKKGSDGRKCLHYLDRAVELNDYDEAALVARSRSAGCSHLGQMFINVIALGNEGGFLNSQCKTYQFIMNAMVHFRCHHHLGKNKEAIDDAMAACEIQPSSGDCREGVLISIDIPPP